jgi:hypothetical protein
MMGNRTEYSVDICKRSVPLWQTSSTSTELLDAETSLLPMISEWSEEEKP